MKKSSCLIVLSVALTSTAWGACKTPDSPRKYPDGKTASLADMKAGQKMVSDFQATMDAYRACLKDEHDEKLKKNPRADEDLKKAFAEDWQLKDDRAMDEKEKAVSRLNEQIAAYKARSK